MDDLLCTVLTFDYSFRLEMRHGQNRGASKLSVAEFATKHFVTAIVGHNPTEDDYRPSRLRD